jgi:hypothetical protein
MTPWRRLAFRVNKTTHPLYEVTLYVRYCVNYHVSTSFLAVLFAKVNTTFSQVRSLFIYFSTRPQVEVGIQFYTLSIRTQAANAYSPVCEYLPAETGAHFDGSDHIAYSEDSLRLLVAQALLAWSPYTQNTIASKTHLSLLMDHTWVFKALASAFTHARGSVECSTKFPPSSTVRETLLAYGSMASPCNG